MNHVLLNIASNYKQQIAYLKFLMTETPENYNQSLEINAAYLDMAHVKSHVDAGRWCLDAEDNNTPTVNFGLRNRKRLFPRVPTYIQDILDLPIFNNNRSDSYVP